MIDILFILVQIDKTCGLVVMSDVSVVVYTNSNPAGSKISAATWSVIVAIIGLSSTEAQKESSEVCESLPIFFHSIG